MNAMTWWDHQTESVWSQVWGQAIAGPLKGTTLELIPAAIVPWGTWKAEHPGTLALDTAELGFVGHEIPSDNWVIGVTIGEAAKAYYFTAVAEVGLVNDWVGPYPVAVYADAESRNVHVYLRQMGEQVLTLSLDETRAYLVDTETRGQWDIARGLPKGGDFRAEGLLLVPYISSFDWAWLDFHPNSAFYPEPPKEAEVEDGPQLDYFLGGGF